MRKNLFPDPPILLVCSEADWCENLMDDLTQDAGINNILIRNDSSKTVGLLQYQEISLVLLDPDTPPLSGEDVLEVLNYDHPRVPVIIVAGSNQGGRASHWLKRGAFGFHLKDESRENLLATIRKALTHCELQRENRALRERMLHDGLDQPAAFSGLVTRNRKMISLFKYIEAIAPSSEPVLITGESGVGKELFARAIHQASRAKGKLVAVNAAGLDDQAFSDSLFGHVRGAFTGADRDRAGLVEKAAGGTLFLDEIGDLNTASQVKLLRLLQEGEFFPLGSDTLKRVKVRMLFATNQDLAVKKVAGEFRRDLYYRLCTHHLHIPPLRERTEDIPLLLRHFLQEAAASLGKKIPTPPEELAILLSTYHFPGNIRELRAMVHNAVSLHRSGKLSMESFRRTILTHTRTAPDAGMGDFEATLRQLGQLPTLKEADEMLMNEALRRSQGNQKIAAAMLGISPPALSKRRKKT
ncbi:sigma-54-dependent transcriptional regulator [Geoalkalibacter halelectricus]|uniref:Sigma-54 dependent transcriptional regulator n=1 Tax=Geoalkalibacter halelectricus TaxID=2847045 RepID=A0ABY5ZSM3_9BACT|nr:sigma-54 dependent transcriptional regulator [Geoalkalibacter halelectricus]MDO3377583.1 sigma-54 dependent transcriptional regulator [Geoalkalibacter halelectricus]UWZ80659.1 sigma-54 dependent transcriptional regulator [Geoalkalibacter halelectricus]